MRPHAYLALLIFASACDSQPSSGNDDNGSHPVDSDDGRDASTPPPPRNPKPPRDAAAPPGDAESPEDAGPTRDAADGNIIIGHLLPDAGLPVGIPQVVSEGGLPSHDAQTVPANPIGHLVPDAGLPIGIPQAVPEGGLPLPDAQPGRPDPMEPPATDAVQIIGAGGGGSISGELVAYNPDAANVSGLGETLLYACFLLDNFECDPARSPSGIIRGSLRAGYAVNSLEDGAYLLMAYKDQNGNGQLNDVGDWSAIYSLDGRVPTLLRPPIQNVILRMKPSKLDTAMLPALQYAEILGTWGSRSGDFTSSTMHLYGNGTYDYVLSVSNDNPLCSVAGASFQQGNARLTGSLLTLTPTDTSGAAGGTCTSLGSIGPANPYHFAELWIDEIGRPALILRWPVGGNVLEDAFTPK